MIAETTNRGYGQVIMWGGITGNQKANLVKIEGALTEKCYCQEVLKLLMSNNRNNFMHDNAPVHKTLTSTDFLENEAIDCLPCPVIFPDMNPIKHV